MMKRKKNIFVAAMLASVFFYTCKKKEVEAPPTPQTPAEVKKADAIVYTDSEPDIEVRSVRGYFPLDNGVCTFQLPLPEDSTAECLLDMNGDQVPDFRIVAWHKERTDFAYCGHCDDYYKYGVYISAIHPGDSLGANYIHGKTLALNDTIKNQGWFLPSIALSLDNCPLFVSSISGYVAVKMKGSVGYIHVEPAPNNGYRVLDYGINLTAGRPITCGQKQ